MITKNRRIKKSCKSDGFESISWFIGVEIGQNRKSANRLPKIPFTRIPSLLSMGVFLTLFLASHAFAFEIDTHEKLTEAAITTLESTLNAYLIENLGLEGGLNASVEGGTPPQLIKQGSRDEDTEAFAFRVLNHFHEPLFHTGLLWGDSAIEWSLKAIASQFPGGDWSWNDAREYYFKALTSENKKDRDKYWGMTFQALGHVMHLVQDMASPAHVRNDDHLAISGFGDVDGLHDFMDGRDVFGAIGPDPSTLQQAGAVSSEPFSNLFDQNAYTGENPSSTLGSQAGLAEYANANFFSDDTIPGARLFFPRYTYPSINELVPVGPASVYLTLPRLGNSGSPAARAVKFTGNQAWAKYLMADRRLDLIDDLRLDDAVYDAQSRHLIPRAVGYSAAVLDYFFRGELDVTHEVFEVESDAKGGSTTECAQTPLEEFGLLNVQFTIPSALNFGGDTPTLYFEKSDETRLMAGATVPHAGIANPVRWYVVLDGPAGPGTQESRAILAETGLAEWEFFCDT